jgi:hypothetical protein
VPMDLIAPCRCVQSPLPQCAHFKFFLLLSCPIPSCSGVYGCGMWIYHNLPRMPNAQVAKNMQLNTKFRMETTILGSIHSFPFNASIF